MSARRDRGALFVAVFCWGGVDAVLDACGGTPLHGHGSGDKKAVVAERERQQKLVD